MTDVEHDCRRAAAEARRQKILARGKDRLQQITSGATASGDVAVGAPARTSAPHGVDASASTAAADVAVAAAAPPAVGTVQQPQPTESSQAAAPSTADLQGTSPPSQDATGAAPAAQANSTLRQRTRPTQAGTVAGNSEVDAVDLDDDTSVVPPQAVPAKATPGHQLRAAVQCTQLVRLLLAMTLAYTITHGMLQPSLAHVPPLLLLAVTQAVIIAGAYMLLSSPRMQHLLGGPGREVEDEQAAAKLQGLSLMRMLSMLAPGLAGTFTTLQAATQAAASIGDGAAMFLVSCILLHATT